MASTILTRRSHDAGAVINASTPLSHGTENYNVEANLLRRIDAFVGADLIEVKAGPRGLP